MRAEDLMLRIWRDRNPAAWALLPIGCLYAAAWQVRSALFRHGWLQTESLPVPVIVVGNVIAGGAGKTPLVIELVRRLAACGVRPAVISRGHARQSHAVLEVNGNSDAGDAGDEPVLIARRANVPVFVGRDRVRTARALLQAHPSTDVIVSDDGLQHLRLARDIEICVFDERGTGNGFLLPAGPLREPWPRRGAAASATSRWTVLSAIMQSPSAPGEAESPPGIALPVVRVHRRLATHAVRADGTQRALPDLAQEAASAVAAIAHPERFFAMLRAQGLHLQHTFALPDHDPLDALPAALQTASVLLCTEKDATKLWRIRPDAWAVPLELDLPGGFVDAILQALKPQ